MADEDDLMLSFTITGAEVVPEIEVPVLGTVLHLKQKIEMSLDVDVARQTLYYNDQVLSDDKTFGYYFYVLGPFGTVALEVTPLPAGQPNQLNILVKSSFADADILVEVEETSSVLDLKRKLERRCGILAESMTLHRLSVEMVDDFPLSAYYVCEGSHVGMKVKIEPR